MLMSLLRQPRLHVTCTFHVDIQPGEVLQYVSVSSQGCADRRQVRSVTRHHDHWIKFPDGDVESAGRGCGVRLLAELNATISLSYQNLEGIYRTLLTRSSVFLRFPTPGINLASISCPDTHAYLHARTRTYAPLCMGAKGYGGRAGSKQTEGGISALGCNSQVGSTEETT